MAALNCACAIPALRRYNPSVRRRTPPRRLVESTLISLPPRVWRSTGFGRATRNRAMDRLCPRMQHRGSHPACAGARPHKRILLNGKPLARQVPAPYGVCSLTRHRTGLTGLELLDRWFEGVDVIGD